MTTDGYEPEMAEVRALLDQQIDLEDLADPTLLYLRATKLHAMYTAVTTELARVRGEAVGRLHEDGMSYGQIAAHLGISRPRAQQLAERSR